MIRLENFEENFKNEDTAELKRKEFLQLYDIFYKKNNPDIDLNDPIYLYNSLYNHGDFYKRYTILNRQMVINSILQKIMNIANCYYSDFSVSPFNRVKINDVVKNDESFKEELLKNGIEVGDFEIGNYSLDELRSYLYNSLNIKHKSVAEMYEESIYCREGVYNIDVGELIVQGVNPYSITDPKEPAYVDEGFIEKNFLFEDYIIKGQIYGRNVLTTNKKRK